MGFRDWLRLRKRKRERPEPASLHCSFCGRSGVEAKKLIAGPPPFFICDLCVGRLSEMAVRDQTRVASLPGEVHQAETEALAPGCESALEGAKAAVRPEIPHFAADAQSDVQRAFAEVAPQPMRNLWKRRVALAAGALSRPSPLAERKLPLSVLHCAIVAEGSDIAWPCRGVLGHLCLFKAAREQGTRCSG